MLNTTAIIKKTCWFAQNISGLIELLYARFLFSYPANAIAWFRTMMQVRLETEESKINNFIDVKMNVIMIQPSLSSQRLTGYWQDQAAGFNTKFYLLSQAWSLAPWCTVRCQLRAWRRLFIFTKLWQLTLCGETLSSDVTADTRLGHCSDLCSTALQETQYLIRH